MFCSWYVLRCYSSLFIDYLIFFFLDIIHRFIFNFARESEPNSWEDTMKDELDRRRYPRMPWHDVHCALWGPPCRDIARHFVQRWNYAKVRLSIQSC